MIGPWRPVAVRVSRGCLRSRAVSSVVRALASHLREAEASFNDRLPASNGNDPAGALPKSCPSRGHHGVSLELEYHFPRSCPLERYSVTAQAHCQWAAPARERAPLLVLHSVGHIDVGTGRVVDVAPVRQHLEIGAEVQVEQQPEGIHR